MSTAVLVDAGFFLKRYDHCFSGFDKNFKLETANDSEIEEYAKSVAINLHRMCLKHMEQRASGQCEARRLHRIFVYDCPPFSKKQHFPKTKTAIDFSNTNQAKFRNKLHQELRSKRLVALRLGYVAAGNGWRLKASVLKKLLSGKTTFGDLEDHDFELDLKQKGVDMKIGLDIASLAYKKLVNQIILVSGDADFVPAAKLARREGIDFVLDPMWNPIKDDLNEHVDGIRSVRKLSSLSKDEEVETEMAV